MAYVYVLQSNTTGKLYVGFSQNIKQRIQSHNNGEVRSTKTGRPWVLIFLECYRSTEDALRREKYLKTTPGKRGLKMILRHTLLDGKNADNARD